MNRPLVWVALGLAIGTYAVAWGWMDGAIVPSVLAAAGMATAMMRRSIAAPIGVALVFAGAGALLWHVRHELEPGDPLARFAARKPASSVFTLEGTVEDPGILLPGDDYTQFYLRADTVTAHVSMPPGLDGGVLVRWSNPGAPVFAGDRVRIAAPLELDIARVNPGVGSAEDFYRRRGIHTSARIRGADAVTRLEAGPVFSPARRASQFRQELAVRLHESMPAHVVPFVLAVWLGDQRRIDQVLYTDFVRSGTAHILSVSGVHMAIVFVSSAFVLRIFVRHRRLRTVLIMAAVVAFALVSGARAATMRSALMVILYLAADLVDREPDAPNALGIAAILAALYSPDLLLDGGFQLSFLSIASILLYSDSLHRRMEVLPRVLRGSLASGLAVQVLPFPIAAGIFNTASIVGLAANLVIIPLLGVVLWLCFLATGSALAMPPIAPLFGHALAPVVDLVGILARFASAMPFGFATIPTPTPLAVTLYAGAAAGLWIALRNKIFSKRWAGAAAILALLSAVTWRSSPPPQIAFLDVGHGDSTFIRTPGGTNILVDAGDRSEFIDAGARQVAPYLLAHGVTSIDALVITHADRDHIGGAEYLLEHFRVGIVYLWPLAGESELERDLLAACAAAGVPVRRLAKGDSLPCEGARIDVLHPPPDWAASKSENDASLVLRVTWPGMSVLLPGDIEEGAESLLTGTDCAAAVLKVPHHGSQTSSTDAFIDSVNPRLAIVSAGRRRGGSVVRTFVIQRYTDRGIEVLRTDRAGGIALRTDGQSLRAESARQLRGYPIRSAD